ncbi:hypothetical protein IE077_002098 [Cardiosporidium cionae]|uniref:tRNA pseudouridine(55) synthase n=1 Tax=Cardiosporidium cionae TaxID=476202 RepID=A0ABQ7JCL5_9APIC|nr:hypothetical protein IE077_002098 [Cardiosporidium cionae]|eukprot:KAF8821380.1 hypothetical protein IE077_002098 [Cardiosporidium cionae]
MSIREFCAALPLSVACLQGIYQRWYRKFCRHMSHSIWFLEGETLTFFSVEEAVGLPFLDIFQAESLKFSSAGREDRDVRMLEGRPFLVELTNAEFGVHDWPQRVASKFQKHQGIQFENSPYSYVTLNKDYHLRFLTSSSLSSFFYNQTFPPLLPSCSLPLDHLFQLSTNSIKMEKSSPWIDTLTVEIPQFSFASTIKECTVGLQYGAEEKRKTYDCLVVSTLPLSKSLLEEKCKTLQHSLPMEIAQSTPIRVLHRRNLACRKKWLYKLEMQWLHPYLFLVQLETHAGMYIKEFIHGDLGRTLPNLSALFDNFLDVLQLDVRKLLFSPSFTPPI